MVHPWGFYGATQFKGQWPLPAEGKFKLLVNFGITVDGFQPWQTFKLLDGLFVTGKQVQTCLESKDGVSLKVLEWELNDAGSFLNSATKYRCACTGQFLSASAPHP